jgi:AcrR family transcriptional regulator
MRNNETNPPVFRSRDREATKERIVEAAVEILTTQGFVQMGVNALAARAGVDKQLIYRYFDGVDGVVAAVGAQLDLWLGARLATDPPKAKSYAELIGRLLDTYIDALRASLLMQRLIAWELVAPSPILAALEASRSRALMDWMERARGVLRPPPGIDASAVNALLLAGVHHLALREASVARFAGLACGTEADWDRIRRAARALVDLAYAPPALSTGRRVRSTGGARGATARSTLQPSNAAHRRRPQ